MSLEKQLKTLGKDIKYLENRSLKTLQKHKKYLDEVRKNHPKKHDDSFAEFDKFLHGGSHYIIPIQNWKTGTVFQKKKKCATKVKNKHSAAQSRTIPMKLSEKEFDYLLTRRYDLTMKGAPLRYEELQVSLTRTDPIEKSHPPIWKEFM